MRITVPYGEGQLEADLGERATVVKPRRGVASPIELALAAPIGSPRLHEIVRPGQSVAIVTSDITRPCPSHLMLPPILDELAQAGILERDVTVVLGVGIHRPHTQDERLRLVGSGVGARIHCIDSDPTQTVRIGTTRRGTPVEVFEPVLRADVRVVMGNVEPHYFAGYSGGAKALVPGVSSANTIRRNHALMVEAGAAVCVLDGNPVREDLEEAAAMIGIDFMLNVILNGSRDIVLAAAGHPVEAHRWLCKALDYQSKVPIDQLADVVLVSAGGAPKDINMYQAHKALDNAAEAVRPGGIIIWVAECPEGLGNATFESWMVGSRAEEILARIKADFVLGGHKAAAIARVQQRATILLVSALPPDLVRACGMTPYSDVETALRSARRELGESPLIYAMPEGAAVLPSLTAR